MDEGKRTALLDHLHEKESNDEKIKTIFASDEHKNRILLLKLNIHL